MDRISVRSLGRVFRAPSARATAALRAGLPVLLLATACATAPGRVAQESLDELERGADGILKAGSREPVLLDGKQLRPGGARYPFQGVWTRDGMRLEQYQRLYVAPVDTSHLRASSLWDRLSLRGYAVERDAVGLAVEAREIVMAVFRDDPARRFTVVDEAGKGTLVLRLAIVELVPSKAWLATIGLGAWAAPVPVGVPVGLAAVVAQRGYTGIEGTIEDGATGEPLMLFADREANKVRPVDLQSLSWYAHSRESLRDWAAQLHAVLTTPSEQPIGDEHGYRWRPW